MKKAQSIRLHDTDNVLTALEFLPKGTRLYEYDLEIKEEIKFGHKIALCHIHKGEKILKYGVPIGIAYQPIPQGAHVHLHNLKSLQVKGENHEGFQEGGWKNRNT